LGNAGAVFFSGWMSLPLTGDESNDYSTIYIYNKSWFVPFVTDHFTV